MGILDIYSKEREKLFRKYFGIHDTKFRDNLITAITGKYIFDTLAFDDWLHKEHGYNEDEHGSCADFITLKYGKKACEFIEALLKKGNM